MAWLRRPKVLSSHNKPDSATPCDGALDWGKSPAQQIRRECPLCGYREVWDHKGRKWSSRPRNEHPGQDGQFGPWVRST